MKKLIAAGLVSVALLFGGCSGGGYGTVGPANLTGFNGNPGGSTPVTQPSSNTALFHPAAGVLPYPTDLYFAGSTDGTLNIQPANALIPNQAAINALDGFSTTAVIRERFGGALNPASFTAAWLGMSAFAGWIFKVPSVEPKKYRSVGYGSTPAAG